MNPQAIDPATEEVVAIYTWHTSSDVDDILGNASSGSMALAALSVHERLDIVRRMAELLRRDVEPLAQLITAEMGKPLSQSRAEVLKCALLCDVVAESAPEALADEVTMVDGTAARIRYAPLGPVLAIMPWNFPLWQTLRFGIPALAVGNAMVLKPAPSTFGTGERTVELLREAGVPAGAAACARADVDAIGGIIADRRVRGVTFTGSTKAGRIVAEHAGRALKKSVLELGGNDAYIVCDDADPERALEACIAARCVNNGQSCIAGKRFYVHERLYAWFVETMAERFDAMVVGDPRDPLTEIGPLARRDLRDGVVDQVRRAIADGARMVTQRPVNDVPARGWFMRPVVLADLPESSPVADEEIFGPVAVVRPFTDVDDVIARVHASSYGLGGGVFSRDLDRAHAIAERLDTGMVAINDMLRSDPRLPFGGVKDSGYGRELGQAGLREFASVKVIR